ncbi:hypothetical protein ACLBWS_10925 [Brucellaceae bacterium D45D]
MNYINKINKHRYTLLASKEDYAAAVQNLGSYIAHVGTLADPILTTSPDGYQKCLDAFQSARVQAGLWSQGPSSLLISIPQAITNGLQVCRMDLQSADDLIQAALQKTGGPNASDLSSVIDKFQDVSTHIATIQTSVNGLAKEIVDYAPHLKSIGTDLDNALTDINEMEDADKKLIADIQTHIAALKADIGVLAGKIATEAAIGIGAGALGAAVYLLAGPIINPVGWVTIGFCIVVVGFEIANIALDASKIKADQDEINSSLSKCDALNADVAQLNVVSDTVKGFIGQAADTVKNLTDITAEWVDLSKTVGNFVKELSVLLQISDPTQMTKIATECADLKTMLQQILDDDERLSIDEPKISDGDFSVGDSEDIVAFKKEMSNITNIQTYIFNKNNSI